MLGQYAEFADAEPYKYTDKSEGKTRAGEATEGLHEDFSSVWRDYCVFLLRELNILSFPREE